MEKWKRQQQWKGEGGGRAGERLKIYTNERQKSRHGRMPRHEGRSGDSKKGQ